ncbi:MAG: PQQ-binding-like beta-propeller repeat protein, partial [Candidatus Saccharimonas sp.]|nr:PQQ-binding-like beta-propeller repeat protein [Planctomycetaceae bacterium]
MFGPGPQTPRGMRAINRGDGSDASRTGERDFIDSRAPHDAKVEQVLRAAEAAIQRKDWKGSQELLQRLLDLPEDSLHRLADGRWQSVRRTANKLLGSAPVELLDDYRTQYSGLAQQMLAAAKRSGRSADYVNVAARFFHTPAGYEAANYLGTLHFDRGEFGLAAAWFEDLANSPAAFAADGAWRLKAALAYRQAGNSAASLAMLAGPKNVATQAVELGSGRVNPTTWLNGLAAFLPTRVVSLADWTQLYGTVARMGKAIGGEPLLSPLWSVPMTTSHTVRRRVSWIVQDLLDQDRSPIMASMPLVVGGHALYRDLRGVRSVDLETGKTLWESIEGVSPERIVGGLPPQQVEPREAWRFRMNQFQVDMNEYQGQAVEYHPLANLLFRDGTYNLISSDGRQVFVIEDHGILSRNQPGHHWGWDGSNEVQDPYGVPWKTNRLVSYDLRTGRPLWSVGGVESLEPFDLPLAGSYFYGVPAVDGDELLVVAGKGDDIRLWSLDRATGTPRWSQLIAYSDTKIEQDVGRRWYTAQVASDGGIIVCPTTVGWLVAVDRLRQSVLWAHRYLPPSAQQERDPGTQFVPQRDLATLWSPSAPIISGSVVVYTPPEESVILALNALDGKRLWEKQKENWLYLAGVFDDRVILVGRSEIGAFALATGKSLWTSSLGDEARPSGRGLAVGDLFYLPLSTGELRTIDLKHGKAVSHTYAPNNHPPLGNLAMHRGKLVALGPHGLVGFGQREAVLAEIQRRKAINPTDPSALLRESEIHLLNRTHAAALPLLRAIVVDGLTDDEKARCHTALVESLAAVIRLDPQSHVAELTELGRVATAPDEKRLHQELTADSLIAEGRLAAAFDVFWSLADSTANKPAVDAPAAIVRTDDRQVSTRRVPWITGRLSDVWSAATGDERKQIDTRIEATLAEAAVEPSDPDARSVRVTSRSLLARLLAFHPATVQLQEAIVEELAAAKDFGAAQLELLKRVDAGDRVTAARAVERLARLMEQFDMPADAAYYYRKLASEFAGVTLREGQTVAQLIELRRGEGKLDSTTGRPRTRPWDDRPLQLLQGAVQYSPPAQEVSRSSSLPYFDPLAVEVHPQEQRLAFESRVDGSFAWLAPLRSSPRNQGDGYVSADFLGHQVVVVNRDVLHLFSPIEKRLLWSKPLDGSGEGGPFWRHASRPQPQTMITAGRDSGRQMSLLQSAQFTGRLAVVQPNYLCLYGRRSFTVLDPRTGEELWRKDGLPQYSQVVGHRDAIFVVPQDNDKAQAYRALDGQPLKIDGLGSLIAGALLTRGDSLLVLEQGPSLKFLGISRPKTIVRLVNPLTKVDQWKIEFPPGSLVSTLDDDELLVVPLDGKAERIEIATGRRSPLAPL